ncbi:MAG TPA: family 1 glycosylhydrolase [Acidimicrobiia bacterium]|nr:family 1 glycosylhydrolase [Acidimicrobiia bacterium]
MSFPSGFWWGTGASSTQAEGAAPAGDWFRHEREGRMPPSGDGNGFGTRYAEDFELYAQYGLTHHRISIEWARIEPEEGRRDPAAIEHYIAMLTAARDAGISPWVCLHHFTLPGWFTEMGEGGFVDDRARSYYWARHVAFCAETFGDLVFGWKPINEPGAYAGMYFRKNNLFDVLGAVLLAQRDAWRELRGGGKPVSTIHNLSPIYNQSAADLGPLLEAVYWNVWMRADRDGVLALPGRAEREVPDLREACDLIGFSYYSATGISPEGEIVPYPSGARVGPMGYAPWSEGLGIVIRRLDEELPNRPLLICEHGVGTRAGHEGDDEWRCDILRESLAVVEEAVRDGIDLRGFFHWTGVDNYEWNHGFDVQFGCFNREREPRGSAELMAEYARRSPGGS